ncbi:MAG TPA: hypothetical protein VGC17_02840 [Lactovum miscens]|uniref:hypothetical protein n=1 Tax=Lactovum miscens TaxID=190387 RepID=UPI002EDA6403
MENSIKYPRILLNLYVSLNYLQWNAPTDLSSGNSILPQKDEFDTSSAQPWVT